MNSACEKAVGKSLAARDHHALELFAPKLIHESRTCSIVHMLPPGFAPEKKHYPWSTDRRIHYNPVAAFGANARPTLKAVIPVIWTMVQRP